jgi:hypothetical protein
VCGNGGVEKKRVFGVFTDDGQFVYEPSSQPDNYEKPLENVIDKFLSILDSKEKPSLTNTFRIHIFLTKLGDRYLP